MTYEIRYNAKFNSHEVYFDGKPSEDIRTALKSLKMRWHSINKCWYGYSSEGQIVDAILGTNAEKKPEELATVVSDGYLGGGAVYGSKSNLHLYGADLAKAIRADLKAAGIKGVTIASKNGNIRATLKTGAGDVRSEADFVGSYTVKGSFGWVDYTDENGCYRSISVCDFYNLPDELRERIRVDHAKREYSRDYAHRCDINKYYIEKYDGFTPEFLGKMSKVLSIIEAYRYDESNSMVDYFNTNFYISLYTVPAAA